MFHFDGSGWSPVPTGTGKHLLDLCTASDGRAYVIGTDGAFLRGTAQDGFTPVGGALPGRPYLTGIAEHEGGIWIAGSRGLFRHDLASGRTERVATGLVPEVTDLHHLDARDGVLWSIGFKDLVWLDGAGWHRLDHPDNPPIR